MRSNRVVPALTLLSSLVGLGLPSPPLAASVPAVVTLQADDPSEGEDPSTWSTPDLREAIVDAGEDADPAWFEILGARRDPAALDALVSILARTRSADVSETCALAFRHFADTTFEEDAIEALRREIVDEKDVHLSRARTYGLVALGDGAERALREVLRDHDDPETRSIAIGGLVTSLRMQRDVKALRLLLEHYRPPVSGPHELGVRTIASFRGEEAREAMGKALLAEHKNRALRAMVAEALAGTRNPDVEPYLIDGLRSKVATVRRACLDALGQLGATKHRKHLKRLSKDQDPRVRHAAFREKLRLVDSPQERLEMLHDGLEDKDWAVRLASLDTLVALPGTVAFQLVVAALADSHPRVRQAAIEAHLAWRKRKSIPHLVDLLERDSRRLREQAADALQLLTGLDLGQNPRRWQQWWTAEGYKAVLPTLEEARQARADRIARRAASETQGAFYGIPLISDRVCFVLDTSGSMDTVVDLDGTTRLMAVQDELVRSLDHIPDGARFNMIFFESTRDPFQKKLVEMTPKVRDKAKGWVKRKGAGGGTAIYDAIMLALEDPDVDTLVVLSDGQPSGGTIDDPIEILERVQEATELSEVVIHAVSFDAPGRLLERLTKATGGQYREAR